MLGQLVTSLMKLSTLLQDANNLFQICKITGNKQHIATHSDIGLMDRLVPTCLKVCEQRVHFYYVVVSESF